MNSARSLMAWAFMCGLWLGCGNSSEAPSESNQEAAWPRDLLDTDRIDLHLSEAPGHVMGRREEALGVTSGPLPLFTTVPEPHMPRRIDPRRSGPPTPSDAAPLPHLDSQPRAVPGVFSVSQYAPEGEVERPREIRVRFSEDVAGIMAGTVMQEVPIAITPAVQGEWRWLDARTLSFLPRRSFSPATTYEVAVAAAFRSSKGEKLKEGVLWTFSVDGPKLLGTWPSGSERDHWPRSAPILLAFDRAVDTEALSMRLALHVEGEPWPIRILDQEAREQDESFRKAAMYWPRAHLVALRPNTPLPSGAEATLVMAFDTEAPEPTEPILSFRTRSSFSEAKLACFWAPAPYVRAEFAIDAHLDSLLLAPDALVFDPELQEKRFALIREDDDDQGRSVLVITGLPPPGTTSIRATLRPGVLDREGVASGREFSDSCELSPVPPRAWPTRSWQVSPKGELALHATGSLSLDVQIFPISSQSRDKSFACFSKKPSHNCLPSDAVAASAKRFEITSDAPMGTTHFLDLSEHFDDGTHSLFIELLGETMAPQLAWLERASTVLFAEQAQDSVVAFAVSAEDGAPRSDMEITLVESGIDEANQRRAVTDSSGIVHFHDVAPGALRVESEAAFAPIWREPSKPHLLTPSLIHRPGDAVELAGIVFPRGEARQVALHLSAPEKIAAPILAMAPLDDRGRFQKLFRLPKAFTNGIAELRIVPLDDRGQPTATGEALESSVLIGHWSHSDDEAARLEVVVPEVFSGEPLLFQIDRNDRSKRTDPLSLDWSVEPTSVALRFVELPGFVFGDGRRSWVNLPTWISTLQSTDTCRIDGKGHRLSTLLSGITATANSQDGRPVEVTARLRIANSPMQKIEARGLVQPASKLVGIKSSRFFFHQGESAELELLVTDVAGQVAPGHDIALEVFVQEAKPWLGGFRSLTRRVSSRVLKSGMLPAAVRLQLEEKALYRVVATLRDEQGRTSKSEIGLWVEGASMPPPLSSEETPDELFFEPGSSERSSGELLVRIHRRPTAAWIVWEHANGRLQPQPLRLTPAVREEMPSGVHSQSFFWRLDAVHREGDVPPVAATLHTFDGTRFTRSQKLLFASRRRDVEGEVTLQRRVSSRHSTVRVIRDGEPLSVGLQALSAQQDAFRIEVQDALGAPVADADILVAIFDAGREAESDERPHVLTKPFEAEVAGFSLGHRVPFPVFTPVDARVCIAPKQGISDQPHERFSHHRRLNPQPYSAQSSLFEQRWLKTDRRGQAVFHRTTVPVSGLRLRAKVFDRNLGRHGQADLDLEDRARAEIRLQIGLPPFVRPDDRIAARFALDNPLPREVPIRLDLKSAGAFLPNRGDSKEMTLSSHARRELSVPLRLEAGASSIALSAQLRALSRFRNFQERIEVIPELFEERTSGPLPSGAHAIDLAFSRGHRSKRGELEISVSSEALLALQDAFEAVMRRPSLALAVRIARLFALGSLGTEGLSLVEPDGAAREVLWRHAVAEVEWISSNQQRGRLTLRDEHGDEATPFLTLFAVDALLRLQSGAPDRFGSRTASGKRIDALLSASRPFLSQLCEKSEDLSEERDVLKSYALHLHHRLGERLEAAEFEEVRALVERLFAGYTGEPIAWLLPVLEPLPDFDALLRRFEARMIEDGDAAHLASAFRRDGKALSHSEHRADGVALDVLWRLNRALGLRERLERGLLSHHVPGHPWETLQENAWAIAALAPKIRTPIPKIAVRAWFDGFLGEQQLRRDRPIARWHVPLDFLPSNAEKRALVLENRGMDKVAHRIVRRWNDPREDVRSEGISLNRTLDPEGPGRPERGVRSDLLVRAGRTLRVTHALHLPLCQRNLVLRSPLPAGLVALSEGLGFQVHDCQGRLSQVHVVRERDATEFHIDEVGIGEHAIEELWLATHRGDFEVPPPSLHVQWERRGVGGRARVHVE